MKEGPVIIDRQRLLFHNGRTMLCDGEGNMSILGFIICHVLGKSGFKRGNVIWHPAYMPSLSSKRKNSHKQALIKANILYDEDDIIVREDTNLYRLHDTSCSHYARLAPNYFAKEMCDILGLEYKFIN